MSDAERIQTTNVEIKAVKCYVVTCPATGKVSGILQHASAWNGMVELKSVAGDGVIILEAPQGGMPSAEFSGIFRNLDPETRPARVLQASPKMMDLLIPKPPAETKPA